MYEAVLIFAEFPTLINQIDIIDPFNNYLFQLKTNLTQILFRYTIINLQKFFGQY